MLILFDGVCNLCNASVNFVIDHDPDKKFRFASLQSDEGQAVLRRFELPPQKADSVLLIQDERLYEKSTAVLRIARHLRGGWPLLSGLLIVPGFIRNFFYDLVARNRYRWFGRQDSCRMPTPELKERFL